MRVLVCEDEMDLNDIISQKLESDGYSVDSCFDGKEAIDILSYTDYDLIILDIMMPKANGFDVLKSLRNAGKDTPVMFLTARDAIEDRVKGLDSGADDYLVKPFSFEELSARLRAMTRKSFGSASNTIEVADLSLNIATQEVKRGDEIISLSSKEYALLEYLMHNKGIIISREKIEDHIWNFDYDGGTNVVDVYISYLRKKIDEGRDIKLIKTIRGRGYTIKED
ncbi:MAG: response regulator transcription factor [Tissierellia bacterium]|nr:response regulator transcription factor [Tissierellia bacterium]